MQETRSDPIKDALLPEFDHEMGTTRKLLERVPEADFSWKPHERSYSLGQLAFHVANIPTWLGAIVDLTAFDLSDAGDDARPRHATSHQDLLAQFDRNVASVRAKLADKGDAELMAPWTFSKGGHEVFTMPKAAAIRSFVMNHIIHHRGQLSVYLRLRNVPVPAMYGPSADEGA